VPEHRLKRRLERAGGVDVKHRGRDAKVRGKLALARGPRERAILAKELEPSGLA